MKFNECSLTPEHWVRLGREELLGREDFMGDVVLSLELIEKPGHESMSTNGKNLTYDPEFVKALSLIEMASVWWHEGMHVGLMHPFRLTELPTNFNFDRANRAGDYVINIMAPSWCRLPEGVLLDSRFRGMNLREVYDILTDEEEPKKENDEESDDQDENQGDQETESENGKGSGGDEQTEEDPGESSEEGYAEDLDPDSADNGSETDPNSSSSSSSTTDIEPENAESGVSSPKACPWGKIEAPTDEDGKILDPDSDDYKQAEADCKERIEQAVEASEKWGSGMGSLKDCIKRALYPTVPWFETLSDKLMKATATGYSWSRPNKRFIGMGTYLPHRPKSLTGKLVFVGDSSGSVTRNQWKGFLAEANGILEAFEELEMLFIICDDGINATYDFTREDLPLDGDKVPIGGGGGTCFDPPFKHVEKLGIEPDVLVYLTDMDGRLTVKEPDYPVIWVNVNRYDRNKTAPFGEIINFYS